MVATEALVKTFKDSKNERVDDQSPAPENADILKQKRERDEQLEDYRYKLKLQEEQIAALQRQMLLEQQQKKGMFEMQPEQNEETRSKGAEMRGRQCEEEQSKHDQEAAEPRPEKAMQMQGAAGEHLKPSVGEKRRRMVYEAPRNRPEDEQQRDRGLKEREVLELEDESKRSEIAGRSSNVQENAAQTFQSNQCRVGTKNGKSQSTDGKENDKIKPKQGVNDVEARVGQEQRKRDEEVRKRREQQLSTIREQERQFQAQKRKAALVEEKQLLVEKQRNAKLNARLMRQSLNQRLKENQQKTARLKEHRKDFFDVATRVLKSNSAVEAEFTRRYLLERLEDLSELARRRDQSADEELLAGSTLPNVCNNYSSAAGCMDTGCQSLHICRRFWEGTCSNGLDCRYSHSLTTVHNQGVCALFEQASARELVVAQQPNGTSGESGSPAADGSAENRGICRMDISNMMHMSRQPEADCSVTGDCGASAALREGHRPSDRRQPTSASDVSPEPARDRQRSQWGATNESRRVTLSSRENGAVPRAPVSGAAAAAVSGAAAAVSGAAAAVSGAAAALRPPSSGGGGLSEELRCPVCLDLFRRATTLGCGHTFCAVCLAETRDRGDDRCPLCRVTITSAIRSVTLNSIVRSVITAAAAEGRW
ncbi:stress response protein nst1-like isoform X2 [Amphibalanus amphitrite]|nr:stress response protein nst1-like isoform X2 [Amphibalanus amphitrite]